MRRCRWLARLIPVVLFGVLTLSWSPPLMAQEPDTVSRATALKLAKEGEALRQKGDFAGAVERFSRAHQLIPATTIGLRWAQTLEEQGLWLEAQDRYRQTSRQDPGPSAPRAWYTAREDAQKHLERLTLRIPTVVLASVSGLGTVRLDGKELPPAMLDIEVPLNPGTHIVEAEGAITQEITLGERSSVVVQLVPVGAGPESPKTEAPDMSAQRIASLTLVGVGVVGVGLGTIFGIVALGKDADLAERCPQAQMCDADAQDDIDGLATTSTVSTLGFVIGALSATAGVVLFLTEPGPPAVGVVLGPGSVGLRGAF